MACLVGPPCPPAPPDGRRASIAPGPADLRYTVRRDAGPGSAGPETRSDGTGMTDEPRDPRGGDAGDEPGTEDELEPRDELEEPVAGDGIDDAPADDDEELDPLGAELEAEAAASIAKAAAKSGKAGSSPPRDDAGDRARGRRGGRGAADDQPAPAPGVPEPAIRIGDRASAIFVIVTVLTFVLILLNGLLLGSGGTFGS